MDGWSGGGFTYFDENHHITDRTGISGKEEVSERIGRQVTDL
jgi:hypothetical protein